MFNQKEFRKEWIAALRNGEYEQGQGMLSNNGRFCCLGVACDLLASKGFLKQKQGFVGNHTFTTFEGHATGLPPKAQVMIGLISPLGHSRDRDTCLADLNDMGDPFITLADKMETGDFWDEKN